MKVKRVYASPYCWLTFRIRVPYEYVEKLRLLCAYREYKTMEKMMHNQILGLIEENEPLIERQKQIEIQEEKEAEEYRKWYEGEKI